MSTTNNREHKERQEWLDFVSEVQEKLRQANDPEAFLSSFSNDVIRKLANEPFYVLREKQLKPLKNDYPTTLVQTGRGWGKNFTGSHWLNEQARRRPGEKFAVIGETAADVRDYMVEGKSGVLNVGNFRPEYEPSKRRLTWRNGTTATTYSGEKPDQLRGLSASIIWADEFAKMRYAEKVMEQIDLSLRESDNPQLLVTTTPRPLAAVEELAKNAEQVVRGSSFENKQNLGDRFVKKLDELRNTKLGRQEVFGEVLEDFGMWSESDIEMADEFEISKVVIGLDPSISDEEGDECGIVVVGKTKAGNAVVLEDASGQYTTTAWANKIADLYNTFTTTDTEDYESVSVPTTVYAERNQGGGLVKNQLRSVAPHIAYNSVHTQRSKQVRAQPVYTLYEKGKVKHFGHFPALEDQMFRFQEGGDSPDRVDALVYAVSDLLLDDDNKEDAFETVLNAI